MSGILAGQNYIFDAANTLHMDPAPFTASGVGKDEASANIIRDVGSGQAHMTACIDYGFLDVANDDEGYYLEVQGSTTSDFSSDVVVLGCDIQGSQGAFGATWRVPTVGDQIRMPITNQKAGRIYRYVRINVRIAGTSPSMSFRAWLTKRS